MWVPRKRAKERQAEADKALTEAQEHLREVKSRDPEVKAIAKELRIIRENNHFIEKLQPTMIWKGGKHA